MLTTSTPEVVNPVADACEAAGVPCVGTVDPWEAFYFGRGAKPGSPNPFRYSFLFSFGIAQFADAYEHLWPQVKTNKHVGVMYPNDTDGNAFRSSLIPLLEKAGYKVFDPGAYQDGQTDYTSLISVQEGTTARSSTAPRSRPTSRRSGSRRPSRATRSSARSRSSRRPASSRRRSPRSGKLGPQPRERRLLGADLPVLLAADGHHVEGDRRRLHEEDRPAVEPAARRRPVALRRRRGRAARRAATRRTRRRSRPRSRR